MNTPRSSAIAAAAWVLFASLSLFSAATQAADAKQELTMETHAKFFSDETHQPKPLDPQVFVRDAAAKAGTGPQNIAHADGLRPALLADAPNTELFNAQGKPLGFELGKWLGATGRARVDAKGHTVTVRLARLRPKGAYSLFENHFDQQPIGFTPLDGTGKANSFVAKADGRARITVKIPGPLTHENAILLVYHSDHTAHGASRGDLGINAHHQLIARIP